MSTLVFDLDGTICEQTAGGEEYFKAKPKPSMIQQIKIAKDLGWKIIIYTARGMNLYDGDLRRIEYNMRSKTEKWLEESGVPYDALYFGKPPGDMYVDDKGICAEDFLRLGCLDP